MTRAETAASPRPNILLILADDMGYGDLGVFNAGYARTPALDQLVNESICMTQHYSAAPVCSPARAGLLTGRHPIRTGAISPQEVLGLDRMALDEVTLADALRHGGYFTGLVGKWHNGALDHRYHPNARGFDEFIGFSGGWSDYHNWSLDYNGTQHRSNGRYLTDVLTDEGIAFTRRHRDEPFFLCMMYSAPHSPLQAPEQMVQPYLDAGLSLPLALTYAMVEVMDRGIARLRNELEDLGLTDNTILMFSSDNGPAFALRADQVPAGASADTTRFNCGFKGAKGSVYEGGIRVPMVIHWPAGGMGEGRTVDALAHFTDWFPTLLTMTGVEFTPNRQLDGFDISATLAGEDPAIDQRRYWQWNTYSPIPVTNAAIRDGDWKLVRPAMTNIQFATDSDAHLAMRYVELDIEHKVHPENITEIFADLEPVRVIPEPPPVELYNIATDPQELHNQADKFPTQAARMLCELETWFDEVENERRLGVTETRS